MKIVCPHCDFTKEIDETKLPPGAKRATCPKCREKFDLFPKKDQTPPPPPMDEFELEETTPPPAANMQAPPPPPKPAAAPTSGYQAPPMPPKGFGAPVPKGIPWEERQGSFFGDLWATWKMVMFSPGEFFERLPTDNGFKGPLTFGIISGWVGLTVMGLFGALLSALVGINSGDGFLMAILSLVIALVGFTILAPIYMAFNMYVGAALYHLFLKIVGGANKDYQTTFRTMAYAYAPFALMVVPYLGLMVAGVYVIVLAIIGLPKTHGTTTLKAVLAIIVVPIALGIALMIIFGIILAILIPIMQ